jgi:hypothetical protein
VPDGIKIMIATPKITIREARASLFQLDSTAADLLRRELFEMDDQDEPLPAPFKIRLAQFFPPAK